MFFSVGVKLGSDMQLFSIRESFDNLIDGYSGILLRIKNEAISDYKGQKFSLLMRDCGKSNYFSLHAI